MTGKPVSEMPERVQEVYAEVHAALRAFVRASFAGRQADPRGAWRVTAVPSPPPMQSAATPCCASSASIAFKQRNDDPRARRSDGVPKRAGAATGVQPVFGNIQRVRGRHGYDSKGLVDFPQIDIGNRQIGTAERLLDGANWGCGEPTGGLRVSAVAAQSRADRDTFGKRCTLPHQHQSRGAIGDRGSIRRCDGAVGLKGGFQVRDLLWPCAFGLLVGCNRNLAGSGPKGNGRDFPRKATGRLSGLRPRQRLAGRSRLVLCG